MEAQITYRTELVRKTIHLSSLCIPIIYFFIPREQALMLLVPIMLIFFVIDMGRYYVKPLRDIFSRFFGWLLRKHENDAERKRLNGATYVLIAALLSVFIFPKFIALISLTILIIGDTFAALFGRKFGKHRFKNKSLEGLSAFIISGSIVILLSPKIDYNIAEYFIGIFAVVVGGLVEAFITSIDDNLTIPLSVGATMWLLYYWLLPTLNVFKWG
jgi:dolichol kinase